MSDQSNVFDGYIPIREASPLTGKSLYTLRKYCREGKLKKYKFGRDVYLKVSDLKPQPADGPERRAK